MTDRTQLLHRQREAESALQQAQMRAAEAYRTWQNHQVETPDRNVAFAEWVIAVGEQFKLACEIGECGGPDWPEKASADAYNTARLGVDELISEHLESGALYLAKQAKEEADQRARAVAWQQQHQRRRMGRTLEVVGG